MKTEDLLLIIVVGLIINALVLAWIISMANQTKKKIKYMEIQIKLWIKVAEKLGVDKDEIANATK